MAETMIPIFPCRSIDGTWEFYRALGFEQTGRQTRPNPYLSVRRGDIELQFFGWKKHDPSTSMHMCYVMTTDVEALYESFRSGLKGVLGRVPTRGLPRMNVLKDMPYGVRQFLITDPDGIQLRIGQPIEGGELPAPKGKVARSLHTASLLADSKEDHRAAARVLDHLLASDEPLTASDRVKALVMRADMAVHLEDWTLAHDLVAEARAVAPPDGNDVKDELRRLDDLAAALARPSP
ncbi:VOC family protein [Actinomadura graeca]|uniref:VOC family protein n=1 Tax=Actinomadura graeca TaxID=2750812 RepID=A0ABX8QYD9_9ACTN|nr:VOC family protein [Actinomadura graeca]QXJ23004.1 VOC family protein [Actinomadura graeca]